MWIYGDSGMGKTALARFASSELKQKHPIEVAYICCWQHHTLYKVVDALIEQLRILQAEQQDTALKLKKLEKHLDGKPFVLMLDEIDKVSPKDRNEIIYGLCNLGQIGLICISNKKDTFFSLEPGTRSRLNPQFVECRKYSNRDLLSILRDRRELGLAPESCSPSVLERIARLSRGDARIAIQTLRAAAEWAEQERDSRIQTRYIAKVWNGITQDPKEGVLASLTQDHRMLHDIVREHGQITSGELRKIYLKQCKERSRKPIAVRTFSKYVNRLAHSGLIACERARLKGKVRLFKIAA